MARRRRLPIQGLIQTADRTGFEGDGYTYLKNPIWWAGMITSMSPSCLYHCVPIGYHVVAGEERIDGLIRRKCSGFGRDFEFCGIRFCAGDPGDAVGGSECVGRVCILLLRLSGKLRGCLHISC